MHKIVARAPAKLNLTFEVIGELPDGYHEVSTLMQCIDIEDRLTFEFEDAGSVEVELTLGDSTTGGDFPLDDTNLISRALKMLVASLPDHGGLKARVVVDKHIPTSAGLAGGSSDAAAALLALNYHYGNPLSKDELSALAGKLGADVPFCLEGGTSVGRGRGDDLTKVDNASRLFFVVVKPRKISISTAWVYQAYDDFAAEKVSGEWSPPDLVGAVGALSSGEPEIATGCFGNDFEPLVFSQYPQLADMKRSLIDCGSWCCHLTGSGPALYAVVSDREMAHAVRRTFLAGVPAQSDIDFHIAESVQYGARLVG